jgi:hypothetical protein
MPHGWVIFTRKVVAGFRPRNDANAIRVRDVVEVIHGDATNHGSWYYRVGLLP